ncbi:exonuclease domain-containing protein [Fodinicola acaciae]|uniref:exonuclease domain-containing protein n=1 Tax=Fodinicola acaciae TaxID=2681555 RepID=UPI0013CFB8A5|nr:exonuclease domain-containing protein [Fodinicola acaciae]
MTLLGPLRWAVVDVETTGLSPGTDRVLSVAVVHVDEDGRIEQTWSTLLNPGRDPGPVHVHGLTAQMLAGAPTFEAIADELRERLSGRVFVAHNADFDWGFLAAEAALAGTALPSTHRLCTLALVRRLELGLPNHRLGTLAQHWGIAQQHAHDALDDARVAAQVLKNATLEALKAAVPLPLLPLTDWLWQQPPLPVYGREWTNPGILRGPLVQGMRVVITGPTATNRAELYARCHAAGLDVKDRVNRRCSVLVCNDPLSTTVKSRRAAAHGIPVIDESVLVRLLDDVRPGVAAETAPVHRQVRPRPAPVGALAMRRILVLGGPYERAASFRSRIAAAGGLPAVNLTPRISHAVVLDGGEHDPRFERLGALGVTIVPPADFDALLADRRPRGDVDPLVLPAGGDSDLPVDAYGPQWTVSASRVWESPADLDLVAYALDESGEIGDELDAVIDAPNERSVRLDVDALPVWCARVRVVAGVTAGAELGPVQVHIRDAGDADWCTSTLDAPPGCRSLTLVDLYRRATRWRLVVTGSPADLAD